MKWCWWNKRNWITYLIYHNFIIMTSCCRRSWYWNINSWRSYWTWYNCIINTTDRRWWNRIYYWRKSKTYYRISFQYLRMTSSKGKITIFSILYRCSDEWKWRITSRSSNGYWWSISNWKRINTFISWCFCINIEIWCWFSC